MTRMGQSMERNRRRGSRIKNRCRAVFKQACHRDPRVQTRLGQTAPTITGDVAPLMTSSTYIIDGRQRFTRRNTDKKQSLHKNECRAVFKQACHRDPRVQTRLGQTALSITGDVAPLMTSSTCVIHGRQRFTRRNRSPRNTHEYMHTCIHTQCTMSATPRLTHLAY
jgi:hypothetical protein